MPRYSNQIPLLNIHHIAILEYSEITELGAYAPKDGYVMDGDIVMGYHILAFSLYTLSDRNGRVNRSKAAWSLPSGCSVQHKTILST